MTSRSSSGCYYLRITKNILRRRTMTSVIVHRSVATSLLTTWHWECRREVMGGEDVATLSTVTWHLYFVWDMTMRDKEITYLGGKTANNLVIRRLVAMSSRMTWHLVAIVVRVVWWWSSSSCCGCGVVLWLWHCIVAMALAWRGIIRCDGGGDWVAEVWWWWWLWGRGVV